jgi:hypothetical protein
MSAFSQKNKLDEEKPMVIPEQQRKKPGQKADFSSAEYLRIDKEENLKQELNNYLLD